ncbi:MAG: hypothetical protein ABS75_32165 [Pelagibacterium sp. SCN 63-23]|nr:MAG: hypothetical protein ABS75_32165 [Pelagibacterium sp. SCN 63-23]
MSPILAACIEMLFVAEATDPSERIALAAQAGFGAVEFWRWRTKDIAALKLSLDHNAMAVAAMVIDPMISLVDGGVRDAFCVSLSQSLDVARQLDVGVLIAPAGKDIAELSGQKKRGAVIDCLKRAADILEGSGIPIAIEPLNTRVDHPGFFLSSTEQALDIVDAVGRPEVKLTYDLYHSMAMGERTEQVLAGRVDRLAHVHVADLPGRGEPGSGTLPLRQALDWLLGQGYSGAIGFEYRPSKDTRSSVEAALASLRLGSSWEDVDMAPPSGSGA